MAGTVAIFGVGTPDGVGGALTRRFAAENHHVLVAGRTLEKVQETADAINSAGGSAEAVRVDVTSEADQDEIFAHISKLGTLDAVICNAGLNSPIKFEDLSSAEFESFWRVNCYGAFLTSQRAVKIMVPQRSGSLLFTGASASLRGKPGFAHFASAKAALRNLVQALAREYGPQGIHVGHVVIDGAVNGDNVRGRFGEYLEMLGEDGSLNPDAIADAFMTLHMQSRSAWTHELDLRPFKENW